MAAVLMVAEGGAAAVAVTVVGAMMAVSVVAVTMVVTEGREVEPRVTAAAMVESMGDPRAEAWKGWVGTEAAGRASCMRVEMIAMDGTLVGSDCVATPGTLIGAARCRYLPQ